MRNIIAFAALALLPAVAVAQDSTAAACSRTSPVYERCSLTLSETHLFRGEPAEVVYYLGEFRPAPLTRFVIGDSALKYARRYEREKLADLWLHFGGGVMLVAGSFMLLSNQCDGLFARCQGMTWRRGGLMLTGGAVYRLSLVFRGRSAWDATKAVAWHNRGLPR
jgi:hypothetical protein